jgi:hypothetical protein
MYRINLLECAPLNLANLLWRNSKKLLCHDINQQLQAQIVGEIAGDAVDAAAAQAVADAMSEAVESAVAQIESEITDNQEAAVQAVNDAKDEALEAIADDVQAAAASAAAAQAASQAAQWLAGAPVIQTTTTAVVANTNYSAPAYTVGTGRLEIYIEGLRAEKGSNSSMYQYTEAGEDGAISVVVRFHDNYEAGTVITAVSRG